MDNQSFSQNTIHYIETPHVSYRVEKLDAILERRMREFLLSRRQKRWIQRGE